MEEILLNLTWTSSAIRVIFPNISRYISRIASISLNLHHFVSVTFKVIVVKTWDNALKLLIRILHEFEKTPYYTL